MGSPFCSIPSDTREKQGKIGFRRRWQNHPDLKEAMINRYSTTNLDQYVTNELENLVDAIKYPSVGRAELAKPLLGGARDLLEEWRRLEPRLADPSGRDLSDAERLSERLLTLADDLDDAGVPYGMVGAALVAGEELEEWLGNRRSKRSVRDGPTPFGTSDILTYSPKSLLRFMLSSITGHFKDWLNELPDTEAEKEKNPGHMRIYVTELQSGEQMEINFSLHDMSMTVEADAPGLRWDRTYGPNDSFEEWDYDISDVVENWMWEVSE